MATIDHLVVAGGALDPLVAWFTEATGVTPSPGGSHPGVGTRNALVGLNDATYLELIAPDPDQPDPARPRPFGVDDLAPHEHRLVTFALRVDDIVMATGAARRAGVELGVPHEMRRNRPDGVLLSWQLTESLYPVGGGAVPFLIAWRDSPHPSASLSHDCRLDRLLVRHPDPERLARMFEAVGVELPVSAADPGGVSATLGTPEGTVEL
ncbi:MAG: VOC family protein [Acidimicrobiales bacterium]